MRRAKPGADRCLPFEGGLDPRRGAPARSAAPSPRVPTQGPRLPTAVALSPRGPEAARRRCVRLPRGCTLGGFQGRRAPLEGWATPSCGHEEMVGLCMRRSGDKY